MYSNEVAFFDWMKCKIFLDDNYDVFLVKFRTGSKNFNRYKLFDRDTIT